MKQNYSSETNICSIGQYIPLMRHKSQFRHTVYRWWPLALWWGKVFECAT